MLFQFFFLNCAFAFFRAQLHFGDQAAEILIAGAGGNEKRKTEFTTEQSEEFYLMIADRDFEIAMFL